MPIELSRADRAILDIVQQNAATTAGELAVRAGLSPSSAQRRLQRLRENKVILREIAVLDPQSLGQRVTMLVEVELELDRPELLPGFFGWIERTAEVQQAWCITGRGDYMLVVVSKSVEHFDALTEDMINANFNVRKFTTSVVLRTLKRTLAIPVE